MCPVRGSGTCYKVQNIHTGTHDSTSNLDFRIRPAGGTPAAVSPRLQSLPPRPRPPQGHLPLLVLCFALPSIIVPRRAFTCTCACSPARHPPPCTPPTTHSNRGKTLAVACNLRPATQRTALLTRFSVLKARTHQRSSWLRLHKCSYPRLQASTYIRGRPSRCNLLLLWQRQPLHHHHPPVCCTRQSF